MNNNDLFPLGKRTVLEFLLVRHGRGYPGLAEVSYGTAGSVSTCGRFPVRRGVAPAQTPSSVRGRSPQPARRGGGRGHGRSRGRPAGVAHARPAGVAHGHPVVVAHGRPVVVARGRPAGALLAGARTRIPEAGGHPAGAHVPPAGAHVPPAVVVRDRPGGVAARGRIGPPGGQAVAVAVALFAASRGRGHHRGHPTEACRHRGE